MNRLIIIGNGFDLAHGIKTSYHDFILDYLKESLLLSLNFTDTKNEMPYNDFHFFKDELIEIKYNINNPDTTYFNYFKLIKNVSELNEIMKKFGIVITYNFEILKTGIEKLTEYKWVDFEIEYFKELLKIKNKNSIIETIEKNNQKKEYLIKELNNKFELFKSKLEVYLTKQQDTFKNIFKKESLCDCFCEDILEQDVDIISIVNQPPKSLLFLNFNYTNTILPYIEECELRITSKINFIHGDLNYDFGKPIFGFGDETDKRYSEFENEGNNELFKHIKTFEYLKTNNYSNLTRYLAIEEFQVHIYGHSCGLSDRTMLKEIFEHSNCMSIKIFYHEKDGSNDYTEKTHEIYRHFTDKNMMRNKVVNEKYCRAMPQPILN
jgi:hypothetical protein